MNSTKALLPTSILLLAAVGPGLTLNAQNIQHLTTTHPGGMPGVPVVTGVEKVTNGLRVTWDGPSGYYQLFQKSGFEERNWQSLGAASLARRATITAVHSNAFFKVSGPSPQYAGAQACLECHENIHTTLMDTRHATAFETLRLAGQDKNPSCLPCHTVGFSLPTGFISESKTPHLAGVQCESCHGPAARHAASETDPVVRPRVELASQVCGGCHTGSHYPTFDEWTTSPHAQVVTDMNSSTRMESCGRCHSGSARLSLLNGTPLPAGDANVAIVCVTCHDPHRQTAHPAQLRNPLTSTNDFFLGTSDNFSSKYNADVNICAQCHNHRGASWTSTSRPPHHSPQYNFLLGTVGELRTGAARHRARHATLEKQCITCHMPTEQYESEAQPAFTGHTFKVESFDSCRSCHPLPEMLADFATSAVSFRIQQVKQALDFWAANKAPPALQKYGALAWEYTTPGELSAGGPGPDSAEQTLIPDSIKKARFNVYVVISDGSYGVHNGPLSISLLDAARDWIQEELNK